MCIAIYNSKLGGTLCSSTIYNSWENNDMGAGLLWNSSQGLHLFKTYDYSEFYDKYLEIRADENVENIVLHFRISTSGFKGMHNLHPFLVNDDLGFVHNGVISGLGDQEFSDTYQFNEMLKGFKHDFVNCETTKSIIEGYLDYSKLIFLNSSGEVNIFNEDLGHWDKDNWYSNNSYKAINSYVYAGNTRVAKPMTPYNKELSIALFDASKLSDFENEMYVEICEYMGYDPLDEDSSDMIENLMEDWNCVDIYSLYDEFMSGQVGDYNSSYYDNKWDEFGI